MSSGFHDVLTPAQASPDFARRLKGLRYDSPSSLSHETEGPNDDVRRSNRLCNKRRKLASTTISSNDNSPASIVASTSSKKWSSSSAKPSRGRAGSSKALNSNRKASIPASSFNACDQSSQSQLPPLPDALAPNLHILMVGSNPGIQTSLAGHAYAHPSNLFWFLLYSSGITPVRCRPEEDRSLPGRYKIGFTNLCSRPTKTAAGLGREEMQEGVRALEEKVGKWKPQTICTAGKGIWEEVVKVKKGVKRLGKGEVDYGWQPERFGKVEGETENDWKGSWVFVAASTSGLAAGLSLWEKDEIWGRLGEWVKAKRKEDEPSLNDTVEQS